jgi:protein TonB
MFAGSLGLHLAAGALILASVHLGASPAPEPPLAIAMLFEAPAQPEPAATAAPTEPAAAPEPEPPPPLEPEPSLEPAPPAELPQLEPAPTVVAAPRPPPIVVRKPPPRPVPRPQRPAPAAPAPAAPASLAPAAPVAPAAAAPAEASQAAPAAISPSWRGGIAAWLQEHKTYPDEARRLGQEGQARLRFTIARDGRILDAVILDATGSDALDRAVRDLLDALRQSRFPFPAAMAQEEITQTVNIRYTLNYGTR